MCLHPLYIGVGVFYCRNRTSHCIQLLDLSGASMAEIQLSVWLPHDVIAQPEGKYLWTASQVFQLFVGYFKLLLIVC